MAYVLMFACSLFFLWLSGKVEKHNRYFKTAFIIIALVIPCLMAALRGLSVGTDTGGYVHNLFDKVGDVDSYGDMVSLSSELYNSTDRLYLLITYVIGKCGLPFQVLLFIYQALIILPVYFAIKLNAKDTKRIVFGMLIFYLMFFNLSLNMLRQSIAIAFSILGFALFVNKDGFRDRLLSIFLIVIAFGFHDTAIVMIPIYILYILFNSSKIDQGVKNAFVTIISCLMLLIIVFYKPILYHIGTSGLYPKALTYLESHSIFDINYLGAIGNIIIILVLIWVRKRIKREDENPLFPLLLAIVTFAFGIISAFITYTDRIAYYAYFTILLLYFPRYLLMRNDNNKDLLPLFVVLFFIIHWIIVIMINNSNETLPYVLYG